MAYKTNKPIALVLDVDGTLIKNDLTHELVFKAVLRYPWHIGYFICTGLRNKATLKAELIARLGATVTPQNLPYHDTILHMAKTAHQEGREVILCSGSQQNLITPIVTHFEWLTAGFGSCGNLNLTRENKVRFLKQRYPDGFDYVGNSKQDYPVWKAARKAYGVTPPKGARHIRSQTGEPVSILIPRRYNEVFRKSLSPLLALGLAFLFWYIGHIPALRAIAGGIFFSGTWQLGHDLLYFECLRQQGKKSALAQGNRSLLSTIGLWSLFTLGGIAAIFAR